MLSFRIERKTKRFSDKQKQVLLSKQRGKEGKMYLEDLFYLKKYRMAEIDICLLWAAQAYTFSLSFKMFTKFSDFMLPFSLQMIILSYSKDHAHQTY